MKIVINGGQQTAITGAMLELPVASGVFETLLVQEGAPVFFDDHWTRFQAGCRHFQCEPPVAPGEMQALATALIRENLAGRTGVLRLAAWRNGTKVEWRVEAGGPRPHMSQPAFRVACAARILPAPDADRPYKHLQRGVWLETLRAARAAGWDEAILGDERHRIVEACVSNVFFVREGCLHTPALETGPLPGVMRARILALAKAQVWTVREGEYREADLLAASEIWLSNSLIGVRPLSCLGERGLDPNPPLLGELRTIWKRTFGWDPVVVAAQRP